MGLSLIPKGLKALTSWGDDATKALMRYGDDVAKAGGKAASASAKANILQGASTAAKYGLYGGGLFALGLGAQQVGKPFLEALYGYKPAEPVKANDNVYLYPNSDGSYSPLITDPNNKGQLAVLPAQANESTKDALLLSLLSGGGAKTASTSSQNIDWENILKIGVIGLGLVIIAPPLLSHFASDKKK